MRERVGPPGQRALAGRLLAREWWAFLVVGVVLAVAGVYRMTRRPVEPPPPPIPRYGAVPAFRLTDQARHVVTGESLRGRVWVADFVFTSCSGVCPVLTRRMAELDRWAATHAERLRLVSFSVDPERDTPERLAEYAAKNGAASPRWSFLTGPLADVEKAVVAGFKVGMSRERPGPDEPPGEGPDGLAILHGSRFVLVDVDGGIRGYYETDADGLVRLEADVARLLAAGGR